MSNLSRRTITAPESRHVSKKQSDWREEEEEEEETEGEGTRVSALLALLLLSRVLQLSGFC